MPRNKYLKREVETNNPVFMKENKQEDKQSITIKQEPEEELSPEKEQVDLSRFKFEKKPHIKIEYEKDSPKKDGAKGVWEPPNWKEFLSNLKIMRSKKDAPVDTMGCHISMDPKAPPNVIRYQHLVSLMLSSQTKDQVTFAAMSRLLERGLTIENVLTMSDDELGKLIYPVGFWKTKVKYIKKTSQTLKEQYNCDIPDSAEKLCKLTGVGPKMAHICMSVAWDKVTGIGVDTHVHRISNRIGWVRKPTATPEDTRKALEYWIPFELWSEVNHLMVGFGQTICQPVSPLCNECLNKHICPSSGKGRKSPKKTPVKEVKTEDSDEDFEVKKENLLDLPKKGNKKRVTPRKEDVAVDSEFKLTTGDDINNSDNAIENKKESKRNLTSKKDSTIVESKVTKKKQTQNKPKMDELIKDEDDVVNEVPLKRKSPRVKSEKEITNKKKK